MSPNRYEVAFLAAFFVFCGCSRPDSAPSSPTTTRQHDALTALFRGPRGTYLGADGLYTVRFRGQTLAFFSDTLVGEVRGGEVRDGAGFVNNAMARVVGTELRFSPELDARRPFIETDEPGVWYWPGMPVVVGGRLHLFLYRMTRRGEPGPFDFRLVGCDVATFDDLDAPTSVHPLPYCDPGDATRPDASWGTWVLEDTENLWVFGVRNAAPKELLVARVARSTFIDDPARGWTFWDGDAWQPDAAAARPVTTRISNELGVLEHRGRFVLVFQLDAISNRVAVRFAETPIGPWSPPEVIWEDPDLEPPVYGYNAKPHPALASGDAMPVSYNVNTMDLFGDFRRLHTIYHPRLVQWKIP